MRNLLTLSRWESNLALTLFLAPLCTFLLSAAPAIGQIDVWVDPGHCCGGEPGALGFNGAAPPNEKDLTLAVANYLQGDLLSLGYFAYKTVVARLVPSTSG